MLDTDLPEFLRIVNGLAAVKPGKPLTTDGLDLYWGAMREWPLDEFKAAACHLMATSEFMPNPFHFHQLRKAAQLTAGEAWAKALDWVRSGASRLPGAGFGDLGRREHPDALISAVIRSCGGWKAIGDATEESLPFIERRFAEHYEALQDRTQTREALPQITGPWLTSLAAQKRLK